MVHLKSIANVMKEAGCEIPEFMLELKKPNKRLKSKLAKSAPKRQTILRSEIKRFKKKKNAKEGAEEEEKAEVEKEDEKSEEKKIKKKKKEETSDDKKTKNKKILNNKK